MSIVYKSSVFLIMSNCSICDPAPVIEEAVEDANHAIDDFISRVDAGIATLDGESEAWRDVVEDISENLPEEIQETIRTEIQQLATRTIAHVGVETRCEVDFLARRARQALEVIRALVLNQEPQAFEPFICQVVPEVLNMNLSPTQRTHISFYGFDLDELDISGEELSIWINRAPGHETLVLPGFPGSSTGITTNLELFDSIAATQDLAIQTHYTALLNTADSNGYVPSEWVDSIRLMWGDVLIAEIPVIAEIVEEPEPEPEPVLVGAEVQISGSVYVEDDENWPYDDETGTFNFSTTGSVGVPSAGLPAGDWLDPHTPTMCVDEVRVSLDVHASYTAAEELVTVSLPIELFEGASCATTDLDGSGNLVIELPVDSSSTQSLTVTNTDEGGDRTIVTVTVTTSAIYD